MSNSTVTLKARIMEFPKMCLLRFPMAILASLLAFGVILFLNHGHPSLTLKNTLLPINYIWLFALFGNVAWTLHCENQRKRLWPAIGLLCLPLLCAYFFFPDDMKNLLPEFWCAYWCAVICLIFLLLSLVGRRDRSPSVQRVGWMILMTVLMATLSAMVLVGGINLAIFSVEKLFNVPVDNDVYMDMFFCGLFLIGPFTAFVWLPRKGESYPEIPRWLRGAARILLIPICVVYALILYGYIGKICVVRQWPDGGVALPTFAFAAVGGLVYFILRQQEDGEKAKWAAWFCRWFPAILLPLSMVLLLAMRIRIVEYGFTIMRAAGGYLSLWILGLSLWYTIRPRCSEWWIGVTLCALAGSVVFGPISLNAVTLRSQQGRLNQALDTLGVWERPEGAEHITLDKKQNMQLTSRIRYLCRSYGKEGLPSAVKTRWEAYRIKKELPELSPHQFRWSDTSEVLMALGLKKDTKSKYVQLKAESENLDPIPLAEWSTLSVYEWVDRGRNEFDISDNFSITANGSPIASNETVAFYARLTEQLNRVDSGELILPRADLSIAFDYQNNSYLLLLPGKWNCNELNDNRWRCRPEHSFTFIVLKR